MIRVSAAAPRRGIRRLTIGYLVSALILILLLAPAATAAPSVIVSNFTVTPAVLMPGDEGTITVVLTSTALPAAGSPLNIRLDPGTGEMNTSTETEENAYIENVLLHSTDVEVMSGSFQDIGEIGPGQSFPVTFRIRAPGEEGIYFPEVWVSVRDGENVRYPVPVNVGTAYAIAKRPALRVERTVPASVDPGDPFNVTLTIHNDGQATASDIAVGVNATSGGIAPRNAENYYIPELEAGGDAVLNLTFETDTSAPLGLTPILVTVDYRGADLAPSRQVATIGIPVVGKAEMGVASIRTEPARITAGETVDLTIRLENTGTADAESVRATIEGLALPGSKEAFLGTIEPGNDGPAIFSLVADEAGEFGYTLVVRYTDDYGEHTVRQALQVVVTGQNPVPMIAVAAAALIVAAAAAIYWYRRRKEE
ncbi:putative carboxyl-terminal-processing protease, deltaproteobacterial [Methanoculleus chikugoensis]|uniref:Putative carboxyl-terminal-processing protease, deltaproteobacterial n=1 Tax=Methanoculleus chikugoensis TaxID=118126 RepID=A0A1M4MM67_9EURY|nr:putative carboxyl-terminal-processing protease, deltaproteobacterial [Methanoculleus chikugoensis]